MVRQTLLSLIYAAHVRTFSFDPVAASITWISPGEAEGAAGAWCMVECEGDDVVLRALGDTRLAVMGSGSGEPTRVRVGTSAMMVGLSRPDIKEPAALYVRPLEEGMARFSTYAVREGATLHLGRSASCELCYANPYVSQRQAELRCEQGSFVVRDLKSGNGTLVNAQAIEALQPRRLVAGDVVEVLDLQIMVGRNLLCLNHPVGLSVRGKGLIALLKTGGDTARPKDAPAYGPADEEMAYPLFYPAPRLSRTAAPVALEVDAPPTRREEQRQPVLMQLGPSLLMGMSSVFMGANAVSGLLAGDEVLKVLPSLSMAVAMLGGMIVWPLVSRAYERRMRSIEDARNSRRYASYLDGMENRLLEAADEQARVLRENRLSVGTLLQWAQEASPQLMSHARTHDDFLELRVGVGDAYASADVSWPQRSFSTTDDLLWERVDELAGNPPAMRDVPLACSLVEHSVVGVMGPRDVAWEFVRGLLVQIVAQYSYHEVKVVLLAEERERTQWEFMLSVEHAYAEGGATRLLALSPEGCTRIDGMLGNEIESRLAAATGSGATLLPHYVVLCVNDALAKRSQALSRLLHCEARIGFSLIYMGGRLSDLPRECGYLIDLTRGVIRDWGIAASSACPVSDRVERGSCMFERADVSSTLVDFDADIHVTADVARRFALSMGRLRLGSFDEMRSMPESLGFLELFGVGNAAHLNVGQRWADSDPARTLGAPVGVDAQGDLVMLDLHESAHGPHGLVAGTTGSGKSEFIISTILSLSACYSPGEIAFVLIDYKGGGLAGAFENDVVRLPHLAGTITNLDGGEVRRALVSIQSELKRRQRLFARAREVSGEATMDIQRYITLCRQGVVEEHLPHLVIVADEFAELKEQEPEFMDELISAARIGRSLGIHLILATQKPTGVVNDQIWANARFKVALKVSDAADSREMIRTDDAALLSRPGAFYLLVGYDELYVGGQAAYAGMPYEPKDVFEPRRDLAVELLNAEGEPISSLRPPKAGTVVRTDELHAVMEQVVVAAQARGVAAGRLWLDPLPARMSLAEIRDVHGKARCSGSEGTRAEGLVFTAGLVDDPEQQEQRRLDVSLGDEGNVLVFGASGTGLDELLRAMLVSLANEYACDELWVYGWDGGSGVLSSLSACPHVGGVVAGSDEERLGNLLRMLEGELDERKRRSQEAGLVGGPSIVLAIANLPALLDIDERLEDRLIPFTRDGPRLGMHVLATSSSTRAIPLRLQANFGGPLVLRMRDESDYATLMGMSVDVVPAQRDRRGIVRVGKRVLEFLGASLGTDEDAALEELNRAWSMTGGSRARGIPVLPARVTATLVAGSDRKRFALGYSKERVQPLFVDLSEYPALLVVGNDRRALGAFLQGACESLVLAGSKHVVLDVGAQEQVGGDEGQMVTAQEAHERLAGVLDGSAGAEVLVVANFVQALERLDPPEAQALAQYLTQGGSVRGPGLVIGAEAWQMASRYEDWVRVATSQGLGLWVGDGFADQTVLRYARLLPAYRQPGSATDAFLVSGAKVEPVRVIEPAGRDGS